MSSFRPKGAPASTHTVRRPRAVVASVAVAAVAMTALIGLGVAGIRSSEPSAGVPAAVPTGMARAGGIEVDGSQIALGTVPLNTTVVPTWTLRNSGDAVVDLGAVHVETIDGCCPSEPELSDTQLAPGQATVLRFPLQMHPGMDGPHHFALHVPVGDETLALEVTGDFRDA